MPLRIPNVGEERLLGFMLGKTTLEAFRLKLYTNNITPGETDVAGTYTECTLGGYAAIDLTAASWTITQGAPTSAAYPQQTFTFTAGTASVYGYFVVGAVSGTLLFAERFTSGPYSITQNGDQIRVTPNFTLQDTLD
jgi:hypothetical protein